MGILDKVALSSTGAFTAASYRQRPQLQENWERGAHEAVELLDCDHGDSNDFIRNTLGSVWYNRNRNSGISRVIPKRYNYRLGTYGSLGPDVTSAISPVSGTTDYAPRYYGRPWYAYKAELAEIEGVPVQWQSTAGDVVAGDMRLIGQSPGTLTADQLSGAASTSDGRETYRVHYKPHRFMVLTDAEQNAIWSANADSANTELHRNVIRDYRFAARNLTLPPNTLYFASDLNPTTGALAANAMPLPEGATMLFPTVNILMTWVDIPWYPLAAINACLGKVNAATTTTVANPSGNWDYQPTIDGTNWSRRYHNGWAPGKLLFDGVHELIEETNPAGQWTMTITYSFIYREVGWNFFYNYKNDTFGEVVRKESIGQPEANWRGLYEEANFNSLFQLPIA